MENDIYGLYSDCFPGYPIARDRFFDILNPDDARIIHACDDGRIIGFSMIHGNSITLLCVEPAHRNRGFGTRLLADSENRIRNTGASSVVLGRGRHYLLQGVPADDTETVKFFMERGYGSDETSVNMVLDLKDFAACQLPAVPPGLSFRFAEDADKDNLLRAVDDAEPSWHGIFETTEEPVLLAVSDGEIVGFEITEPTGGRFSAADERMGSIGCVGVVQKARRRGIGLSLVAAGILWLQNQGCHSVELLYVHLEEWYKKLGFQVSGRQWMGEKKLNNTTAENLS